MNIRLREWTLDDADRLVDIVRGSDMKYMRRVVDEDYTKKDARDYIKWVLGMGGHKKIGPAHGVFRAIELDGVVVGCISVECGVDITAIDGQIGYYLMREVTGRGIATYAVGEIVREAFDILKIERISAYVASQNIASIRVLEKNHFEREGTIRKGALMHGEYVDVALMGILRD